MGYLTADEIDAKMDALAANRNYSGYVSVFNLDENTAADNHPVKCLKIGKGSIPVLVVGGIHAREWAPPDALISLATKLLDSYFNKKPFIDPYFVMETSDSDQKNDPGYTGQIVFDEQTILSDEWVKKIIDGLELYIIPCMNRDGRSFSVQTPSTPQKKWWRTNSRGLIGPCAKGPAPIGVDLNRNFPAGWNVETYYDTASIRKANVALNACDPTYDRDFDPAFDASTDVYKGFFRRESYHGPIASSEPETRNVINLIDSKKIKFYLDVHAFKREIYYPWGINENQTKEPSQSFLNPDLDRNPATGIGGRPLKGSYKEYFPTTPNNDLLDGHIKIGEFMRNAILNAAGTDAHAKKRSSYSVKQSFELYPAPGGSDDYAFSTQIEWDGTKAKIKANLFPVHSFSIESGHHSDGQFWPSPDPKKNQFQKVQREIHAAVLHLLRYVVFWPSVIRSASRSIGLCFIATAAYGSQDHPDVSFLRHFRDVEMQASAFSSLFISQFNKIYYRFSPQVADFLRRDPSASNITRQVVLSPLVKVLKGYVQLVQPIRQDNLRVALLLVGLISLILPGLILTTVGAIYFIIKSLIDQFKT